MFKKVLIPLLLLGTLLAFGACEANGPGMGDSGYVGRSSANTVTVTGLIPGQEYFLFATTTTADFSPINSTPQTVAFKMLSTQTRNTFPMVTLGEVRAAGEPVPYPIPWGGNGEYYIWVYQTDAALFRTRETVSFSATQRARGAITLTLDNETFLSLY